MNQILIRRAEQEDRQAVDRLLRAYISWAWEKMGKVHGIRKYDRSRHLALNQRVEESLKEFYAQKFPEGQGYVAEYNQEIVGIASFSKLSENTCELKRVFLNPEHRRKGWGRRLIEYVINEIGKTHYSKVLLDSMDFMTKAHTIYQTLGFVKRPSYGRRIPDQQKDFYVFMELDLDRYSQ